MKDESTERKIIQSSASIGAGRNLVGRSDLDNQTTPETGNSRQQEIVEALKRSPEADASKIEVEVSNDGKIVTLRGIVDDAKGARVFENIAANIPGVTKVVNRLKASEGRQLH